MFFVREVECCPSLGPTKFLDVGSNRVNESVSGKGVCRTAPATQDCYILSYMTDLV